MNTTKPTKKQIIHEELKAFAEYLKSDGFTVFVSKTHPFEWLHYEKNGSFATVQPDGFLGYNFGTDNKPCKEIGTGISVVQGVDLNLKHANDSLIRPHGFDYKNVKFYKDAEDFINSSCNSWAQYYIL